MARKSPISPLPSCLFYFSSSLIILFTLTHSPPCLSLASQLLLKTRHSSAVVRLAALRCVHQTWERVGEEMLLLLPETVPFIAELMEDSSIEVEKAVHEFIAHVDSQLGEGESVADYLQQ